MSVKERLVSYLAYKRLSQGAFEKNVGLSNGYVNNIRKSITTDKLQKIASFDPDLNTTWLISGEGQMFEKAGNAKLSQDQFIDLEYIPVKARAGFAELQQLNYTHHETFRVIRTEIGESFTKQVIIEIDGDSMEPNYTSGTKVRCKEVDAGDWIYINSGVYVVVYSNFFVVKRVKNSPSNGILTLHSDNTETGGTTDVPLDDVRKIWKVMRIVDAPAR